MMLGAFLLLAASAASEPEIHCDQAMTQSDMNICSYRDYEQADRELNAQWSITAARMKTYDAEPSVPKDGRPGYFATLLEAQRAWISYRDAHCRSEGYLMRGGSGEPLLNNGCRATLTRARSAQLKDLAEEN